MAISGSSRIIVLIPAYNAECYIERALLSLDANREPHDIIIVDDGSDTPLEGAIPSRPNMKIVRLKQNSGVTAALNHGLRYILTQHYEYVCRMDADDVASPDRLAIQCAFLDEHPGVAAVGSWGEVVTEQGTTAYYLNYPTEHREISRRLRHNNCFLHPSLMIRTQAFRETGLYSDSYPSAEDYELMFRLARHYPVANLPEYLVKYTLTEGGISMRKRKEQLMSRFKVQWEYRDWTNIDFYMGIARTIALHVLDVRTVIRLKERQANFAKR